MVPIQTHPLTGKSPAIIYKNLENGFKAFVLARRIIDSGKKILAVCANEDTAAKLSRDLKFFLGHPEQVIEFNASPHIPYDHLSPSHLSETNLLQKMFHLRESFDYKAITCSLGSLLQRWVPIELLDKYSLNLKADQEVNRPKLLEHFALTGFRKTELVEDPGCFAVRGFILDIYSPNYRLPLRLEFFDEFLDSIKFFDPQSQRTFGTSLKEVKIIPARQIIFDKETLSSFREKILPLADQEHYPSHKTAALLEQLSSHLYFIGLERYLPAFYPQMKSLLHYLPSQETEIFLDDPETLGAEYEKFSQRLKKKYQGCRELSYGPESYFMTMEEVEDLMAPFPQLENQKLVIDLHQLPDEIASSAPPKKEAIEVKSFKVDYTSQLRREILQQITGDTMLKPLLDHLKMWRGDGMASIITCKSEASAKRLNVLLNNYGLKVKHLTLETPPLDRKELPGRLAQVHLLQGALSAGFIFRPAKLAFIPEEEIFGEKKEGSRIKKRRDLPGLTSISQLQENDLVVHMDHGIGRYLGLKRLQVGGVENDFIWLQYHGGDRLYIPIYHLGIVQRYVGAPKGIGRLSRLGSPTWGKTIQHAKKACLKLAHDLLQIYSARQALSGSSFPSSTNYYREFEASFPFEETPDQAKAIDDVMNDLKKDRPMDRLVCGDVGYGKTEVALRAAFKAVEAGFQAAILVPTTVLAQQHYQTFKKRLDNWPICVEVLSRFKTKKEQRDILDNLKKGAVDIIIGTHRLVQKDVIFKKLGILIVDEEQRFGVKTKDKLKKIRLNAHSLTLTATPIPRTLNLSMMGIKDISVINTPPVDRQSIRSFVITFDEQVIKEAIQKEVQRGGQVYFVHNRVRSIGAMARYLRQLLPNLRIGVGHGQMEEGMLEKVMVDFINQRYQVLVCTAIIESGLDIPSVNTIIVNRADQFGLAQLYQLRGRVGRSHQRAYAYLLIPGKTTISTDARKRLAVLQDFSDLGAGFKIAYHDLEIRGAGNFLGEAQSGHIAAIGFELYTQLLSDTVATLKGKEGKSKRDPEINIPVAASIPGEYIDDIQDRLRIYSRFTTADSIEKLDEMMEELLDCYGSVPQEIDNLKEMMKIKFLLQNLQVRHFDIKGNKIGIIFEEKTDINVSGLVKFVQAEPGLRRLNPDMKLIITCPQKDVLQHEDELFPWAQNTLKQLGSCVKSSDFPDGNY